MCRVKNKTERHNINIPMFETRAISERHVFVYFYQNETGWNKMMIRHNFINETTRAVLFCCFRLSIRVQITCNQFQFLRPKIWVMAKKISK